MVDENVDSPTTATPIPLDALGNLAALSVLQRDNPLFEEGGDSQELPRAPAVADSNQASSNATGSAAPFEDESDTTVSDAHAAVSAVETRRSSDAPTAVSGLATAGVKGANEEEEQGQSWAHLLVPVLREIMGMLSWQDVRVVRMTCKHWRKAHGVTVSCLTPTQLQAATVTELFPALAVLDLSRVVEQPAESLKQQLLEQSVVCQGLRNLKLPEGITVDDLMLAVAAAFSGLTSLSLEGTLISTDSGSISILSILQQLQALCLARTKGLSDVGVDSLSTLPALTHVSLSGCFEVTSAGCAKLGGIASLTSLNLEGCANVDDSVIAQFTNLINLQTLNLSYCSQVTDKGLEILCEGITAHSLYAAGDLGGAIGAAFGELGRAMAKQHEANGLQGLTSLSLSGCTEVTDAGISKLTYLRNLTSLDILGCWMVTGQGIAALSTLSSLESLSIEVKEGLDDVCLGAVASLFTLKRLRMERCHLDVTDHGIEQIERLARLRELELTYCTGLSDIFIATVGHLTRLQSLNLLKSQTVSQGGLAALNTLRHLQQLDLTGCNDCNDIVFLCLKPLPLTSLSLAYCGTWSDAGLASLAAMVTLRHLDVAYTATALTDSSLKILSGGLTGLTHLRLSGASHLSDSAFSCLVHNQQLQHLNLEGCVGIGNAAMASIAQLPHLTSLNLQECHQVGAEGVACLTALSGLRELNLLDCPGGSPGAVDMVAKLPFLSQLTVG